MLLSTIYFRGRTQCIKSHGENLNALLKPEMYSLKTQKNLVSITLLNIGCLVDLLIQPRQTANPPDMTEKMLNQDQTFCKQQICAVKYEDM